MCVKAKFRVGFVPSLSPCNLTTYECINSVRTDPAVLRLTLFMQLAKVDFDQMTFVPSWPFDYKKEQLSFHMTFFPAPFTKQPQVTWVAPFNRYAFNVLFPRQKIVPLTDDHERFYAPFSHGMWALFSVTIVASFVLDEKTLQGFFALLCFTALQSCYSAFLKENRSAFVLQNLPFSDVKGMKKALINGSQLVVQRDDANYVADYLFGLGIIDPETFMSVHWNQTDKAIDMFSVLYDDPLAFAFEPTEFGEVCDFPEVIPQGMPPQWQGYVMPKRSPYLLFIERNMPIVEVVASEAERREARKKLRGCRNRFPSRQKQISSMVANVGLSTIADGLLTLISPALMLCFFAVTVEIIYYYLTRSNGNRMIGSVFIQTGRTLPTSLLAFVVVNFFANTMKVR